MPVSHNIYTTANLKKYTYRPIFHFRKILNFGRLSDFLFAKDTEGNFRRI
jgi:hypothetical protein